MVRPNELGAQHRESSDYSRFYAFIRQCFMWILQLSVYFYCIMMQVLTIPTGEMPNKWVFRPRRSKSR